MKSIQIHIRNRKLKERDQKAFEDFKPNFAFVFGDLAMLKNKELTGRLQSLLEGIPCAGCSTAGEITKKGRFENTVVIQGLSWEHSDSHAVVKVSPNRKPVSDLTDAFALAQQLPKVGLKAVLVFAPSANADAPSIVHGIKRAVGENVVVSGGLAGDGAQFESSAVYANGVLHSDGLVIVGIYGEAMSMVHGSAGGWRAFGGERTITSARNNWVDTIDNRPALEVYKEALGENAQYLPDNGLKFPFGIMTDSCEKDGLIRAVLSIDEAAGAIELAGDIQDEKRIKFMRATSAELVHGAQQAAEKIQTAVTSSSLIFCISCVGRKLIMGEAVDDEIVAVQETLQSSDNLVGFYSHGEIGPFFSKKDCQVHNQTMTVTVLSEAS